MSIASNKSEKLSILKNKPKSIQNQQLKKKKYSTLHVYDIDNFVIQSNSIKIVEKDTTKTPITTPNFKNISKSYYNIFSCNSNTIKNQAQGQIQDQIKSSSLNFITPTRIIDKFDIKKQINEESSEVIY